MRVLLKANKQGKYWLLSCRGGGGVNEEYCDVITQEIQCGKDKIKKLTRKKMRGSLQYINIFQNFANKVDALPEKVTEFTFPI